MFLWDHPQVVEPAADPWIALTAMTLATERVRLGTLVTPVPRRHIAKLARELGTLDQLSGGRMVLGAGAGYSALPDYAAFGDSSDPAVRAARWDGVICADTYGLEIEPDALRAMVDDVTARRSPGAPFDVIRFGHTDGASDDALVRACAQAGATWWMESSFPALAGIDEVRDRLRDGPPVRRET